MDSTTPLSVEEYHAQREKLLQEAQKLKFGNIEFTADELKANEIFLGLCKEVKPKLDTKFHLQPILYRDIVESSPLYKFLLDMPKGCQQHSHNPCSLPSSWFVKHTYDANVYVNDKGQISIFDKDPEGTWKNVQKLREAAADKAAFDKKLEDSFHITVKEFDLEHTWDLFEFKIGNRATIACKDVAVWEECVYETFTYAIEEGYSCMQIRMFIPFYDCPIYMDPEAEVALYKRCLARAQEKDPNFTVGIIFAGLRFWDNEKVKKFVDLAFELRKNHKDIVIGFDLVAEEAKREAIDFAPVFVDLFKREQREGSDLPLFLHGGESLDYSNTNLYDLMLCNSKRIGHGLNLFKHSYLMPVVKEKGFVLEINPISNQMLKYVHDLRIHPAIGYHNYGLKITINSDDIEVFNMQTIWDFFMVAISWEFSLLDLKKVIANSVESSGLEKEQQATLTKDWESKWNAFISKVVAGK